MCLFALFGVGYGARLPHLWGIHKDTMYSAHNMLQENQKGDCEASEGKVAIYKAVHLHYTKYSNAGVDQQLFLNIISDCAPSMAYTLQLKLDKLC